jgi:C4-dicarboxylate transporter DctM subunit
LLLFVVANMTRQPLMSIVREALPFILVALAVLLGITLLPETVLWLPRLMGYKA